ncbi:hypothetical protein HJC23_010705 [Cyclotella cryptica]|uniref:Uncharacterized protein n=1 Tax=Cyclotella cryptica TaxID=29204 RepID=A0ABD3PEB3_9STRA
MKRARKMTRKARKMTMTMTTIMTVLTETDGGIAIVMTMGITTIEANIGTGIATTAMMGRRTSKIPTIMIVAEAITTMINEKIIPGVQMMIPILLGDMATMAEAIHIENINRVM